jgi:hypothetical protein
MLNGIIFEIILLRPKNKTVQQEYDEDIFGKVFKHRDIKMEKVREKMADGVI